MPVLEGLWHRGASENKAGPHWRGEIAGGNLKSFNFLLRCTNVLFIFLCSFLKRGASVLAVRRAREGLA